MPLDFLDYTYYTTQSLKALLTQEEIAQIYADNALDVELYNYAKTLINQRQSKFLL